MARRRSSKSSPMFKIVVLAIIGTLLWTNNDARTFVADQLNNAEEFVRPETETLQDKINAFFQ